MATKIGMVSAALAALLLVSGCAGTNASSTCQCPKIVAYDDATLKQVTEALQALPSDSVLHRTMDDYESERDDLRFCPVGKH